MYVRPKHARTVFNRAQGCLALKPTVFESRRMNERSCKRASLTISLMITHNDQTTYQTIHFKHNNTNTWAKTVSGINSNRISPTARTTGRTAPSCQILHGWYTSQPTRQSCISGKRGIDNRILTWLTANPPVFWPQNTPTRWV